MKMKLQKQMILPAVVGLLGGIGAWLSYWLLSASSGASPIASSPYLSALFGGLIGAFLGMNAAEPNRKEG